MTRTGYAASLRLVCACDPWELDQPPLAEARQRLLGLLNDYRFVSAADKARALAALLQPALVMGGHVDRGPAMLVVADQPGTGKGTIVAQRCAIYGAIAVAITMRDRGGVGSLDEDLSSQLLGGSLFLNIDNARGAIRSQLFEAALTEDLLSVRVPFRPPVCVDPRKVNISITSNGVSLTPDLALRCGIVRLRKQPAGFRFKCRRPVAAATADRAALLSSIFEILKDWVHRGSPRAETNHDGHARDFWCIVDEIIPRLFDLPRPTEGLKSAALAGADPFLDLLRAVGIILRSRGELPSQPLTAVQILRIAGDEGVEYDGRMIPIESDERLVSMAAAVGRRASGRFRSGPVSVDEFVVSQIKGFLRRDPNNSRAGTFPSKLYKFDVSPMLEERSGVYDPVQQAQQESENSYSETTSRIESFSAPAVTAVSFEAGQSSSAKPSLSSRRPLPPWWPEVIEKWTAGGQDRSRTGVNELLAEFECSLSDALINGWMELIAGRVTLGPALNGTHVGFGPAAQDCNGDGGPAPP